MPAPRPIHRFAGAGARLPGGARRAAARARAAGGAAASRATATGAGRAAARTRRPAPVSGAARGSRVLIRLARLQLEAEPLQPAEARGRGRPGAGHPDRVRDHDGIGGQRAPGSARGLTTFGLTAGRELEGPWRLQGAVLYDLPWLGRNRSTGVAVSFHSRRSCARFG